MITFKTTYTCPVCGSRLVFLEDEDNIWLGCDKCATYVRLSKKEARRYWNYSAHRVLWRDMLEDLYGSFASAVVKG